jgi:DNA-binding CsgD family transcriptional regulator
MGVDLRRTYERWAALHLARGNFDEARAAIERARAMRLLRRSPETVLDFAWNDALILQWSGETERVHDLVVDTWKYLGFDVNDDVSFGDCPHWAVVLWVRGIAADADRAEQARGRRDARTEQQAVAAAHELYDGLVKSLARFGDMERLPHDVSIARQWADAELARALGHPAPDVWRDVGNAWERARRLPNLAYARWREAEARLQAGEGAAGAGVPLREAHALASSIGHVPLTGAIEDLARRARIEVGEEQTTRPMSRLDELGLTPREREVLDLVAVGNTNRQVAEALFISTKTASVHVSNILAKLGVANRGEAAARARELGVGQAAAR